MSTSPELSVVLPCRDEEQALGDCLVRLRRVISEYNYDAEIIVSDSSKDASPQIAHAHGARVIKHDLKGYGRAYLAGYDAARGKILFGADPDGQYDFRALPTFVGTIRMGADFVIGNRLVPELSREAMPWLHRHIGSPLLRTITRLRFGGTIYDTQCGMRAITRDALNRLDLSTPGMEFASEMLVQALQQRLNIVQVPIEYHPRVGASKLRTWRDGLRHVNYLMRTPANYEDRDSS